MRSKETKTKKAFLPYLLRREVLLFKKKQKTCLLKSLQSKIYFLHICGVYNSHDGKKANRSIENNLNRNWNKYLPQKSIATMLEFITYISCQWWYHNQKICLLKSLPSKMFFWYLWGVKQPWWQNKGNRSIRNN